MISIEITLSTESLKNLVLLVESKFSILMGHLSPNTLLSLKCVFLIWAIIIIGNLFVTTLHLIKKMFGRTRKINHVPEAMKSERHLIS
jgi:hypothetical protein